MKSMTGYAFVRKQINEGLLSCEIKTLNSRYLDVVVKMNFDDSALEMDLKKSVARVVKRGRVFLNLLFEGAVQRSSHIALDTDLAKKSQEAVQNITKLLNIEQTLPLSDYPEFKNFFSCTKISPQQSFFVEDAKSLLEECLLTLETFRKNEGADLKKEFLEHSSLLKKSASEWKKIAETLQDDRYERLKKKIDKKLEDKNFDESRIVTEVLLLCEKSDFTEELSRFNSHLNRFSEVFEQEERPMGRKLDFILQELFREVNTLSSKASNFEISDRAIQAKCVLEKMREQVQNVE